MRVMEKRHKDERPAAAEDRMEIGHLEGDMIVGKGRSKGWQSPDQVYQKELEEQLLKAA